MTEVAFSVDEHQVVARVDPLPGGIDQFLRIFCQQHLPQTVRPGRPFVGSCIPECDTAALLRVSRYNRTVQGNPDFYRNIVAILNLYRLLMDLGPAPLVFVLVVAGVVFLKLFDVEVLIISAQVSYAPGHPGIVAEVGERRHAGKRKTNNVEFGTGYMVLVVNGGCIQRPMGVARQERHSRRSPAA